MGYFSNGSEGLDYQATWCDRCVHSGDGTGPFCPVWALHHDWNSSSCGRTSPDPVVKERAVQQRAALDHFIPSINGVWNGGCKMFVASESEWRGREDELRKIYDDRIIAADAKEPR